MATGPRQHRRRKICAANWRRLLVEQFETRLMLDGAANELDQRNEPMVNADAISAYINFFGSGPASRDPSGLGDDYDVNDDGYVTAVDVLQVINLKNASADEGGGEEPGGDEELNDSNGTGPPDTMGGVGPAQVVEMLNTGYTVYDKATKKPVAATVSLEGFWNAALARANANEVQRLTFSGAITGGDFTIGYGPLTSAPIAWSDQPDQLQQRIQTALDGLFAAGNATAGAPSGGQVEIDFGGGLAGMDLVGLSVKGNLTGGSVANATVTDGGGNEVQKLWFADDVVGGNFLLQFPGATSQTVAWSPDPATLVANVRQKLDLMFGAGNSGAVLTSSQEISVVFGGPNAGKDVPALALTSGLITSRPIAIEQTADPPASMVERLTLSAAIPEGAQVALSYGVLIFHFTLSTSSATTAGNLQGALDAVFGNGNTSVSIHDEREFDITFGADLANTPLYKVDEGNYLGMQTTTILTPGSGNDVQDLSMQPLFQLSGDLGTLTLTVTLPSGQVLVTPPITVNPNLEAMRQSIEDTLAAPEMLGPGNVKVLNTGYGDFQVVFHGQYGHTAIPLMQVASTRDAFLQVGHEGNGEGNEVQRLTLGGAPDDSGSFQIHVGELFTTPIAFRKNPTELAGNIQAALAAMFGMGNVVVSSTGSNQLNITFVGELERTDVDLLQANCCSNPSVSITKFTDGSGREIQKITLPLAVSGGSFGIAKPGGIPQTVNPTRDVSQLQADMQAALDAIYGTTGANPVVHNAKAVVYSHTRIDVAFRNQLEGQQVPLMVVASNDLTMGDAVSVITIAAPKGNMLFVCDPRVTYDPASERWFAAGLGFAGFRWDSVLVAVSKTANPMDGWTGFFLDESSGGLLEPDFPQLGYDAEGAYVVTPLLDFSTQQWHGVVVSVPKADLVAAQPRLDNATVIDVPNWGFGDEPVVDSGPADGLEPIISWFERHDVLNPAGPGPATIDDPLFGQSIRGPYREWELYPTGNLTFSYGDLPPQTVPFNSDFSVMRGNIQSALDVLLGPGGAGIFDCSDCGSPEEHPIKILLGPKIPSIGKIPIRLDGLQTPSDKLEVDSLPDNELQHLSLSRTVTGGSFTIQKPGAAPQTVAWSDAQDVLVANLRAALEALFGLGNFAVLTTGTNQFDIAFGGSFDRENISELVVDGSGLAGDEPKVSVSTIVDGANLTFSNIPPYAAQPNTSVLMDWGDPFVRSTVVKVGGNIWRASVVIDENQYAIRWAEIDAATNRMKQSGTIGDPNLSFFMPSIAVNTAGDVVIGFSGSGTKQYPSAYYVVGHTSSGDTTFDQPRLLQAGSGNFFGRWGDYSATVLDPTDPTVFWTFQEYAASDNLWGIKIAAIRVASPDPTQFLLMHNPNQPSDVDGDSHVAPNDAVDIINYINAYGSQSVPLDALGGPYCDVNGDGTIAPNDVLDVINLINAGEGGERGIRARSSGFRPGNRRPGTGNSQ
jgi:hypothetical protein